jgi:hypothetical protein
MNPDGKGMIAPQINQWIRKQVVLRDKLHGQATKILLRHLNVERKVQGDVATFAVKLDPGSEEIGPLIEEICEAAQKDADDLASGVQNYALYAFFPEDLDYFPRKVFRVAGTSEDFERELSPSEPPTEKGLVSQLMRHNEKIMQTMTVSSSYMTGTLQRENQRLAEMNEKFAQQQVDFMVLLQDTMDQAHSRRLAEKKDEVALAMKQDVMAKLDALVPVIINRIAGQTLIPVEDPSFILMGTLLESLTEEQQLNFLNNLNEGQKPLFAEMLSSYEKKKAASMGATPNLISQGIGKKNALPPPNVPGQKQIAAKAPAPKKPPAADNSDLLLPENSGPQHPLFRTSKDRLSEPPSLLSDDPVISTMEQKARDFAARFRDLMQPETSKKTTPPGEK